jgi:hypothetical protein
VNNKETESIGPWWRQLRVPYRPRPLSHIKANATTDRALYCHGIESIEGARILDELSDASARGSAVDPDSWTSRPTATAESRADAARRACDSRTECSSVSKVEICARIATKWPWDFRSDVTSTSRSWEPFLCCCRQVGFVRRGGWGGDRWELIDLRAVDRGIGAAAGGGRFYRCDRRIGTLDLGRRAACNSNTVSATSEAAKNWRLAARFVATTAPDCRRGSPARIRIDYVLLNLARPTRRLEDVGTGDCQIPPDAS